MKTKIPKIFSLALTLVLVASLFGFAVPVSAQPGDSLWVVQPVPATGPAFGNVLLNGSNVTDIAVNGSRIWAINGAVNMTVAVAPWPLYRSDDGGQSWTGINLNPTAVAVNPPVGAAFATPLGSVAVAPDNPDIAAVTTRDPTAGAGLIDTVFITANAGVTWAALPALAWVGAAWNMGIQDIDIGPARTGTLLGREYLAACADDLAGVVDGDMQIIGATAAWASVAGAGVCSGQRDYMAAQFSKNYLGDRAAVGVGATIVVAPVPVRGSVVHIINTAGAAQIHAPVVMNAAVADFNAGATRILAADIAVPSNFDPTTAAGEVTYACTSSFAVANDDVWRIDSTVARTLGRAGLAWQSIAYDGTIDDGEIFAGQRAAVGAPAITTNVQYSENPQSAAPTWRNTQKAPTGNGGLAIVRTGNATIYVGTSGVQSAFSISDDSGVSFNGEALIDLGVATITAIDSIMLSPDDEFLFMATDDTAQLSLWKTTTPVSPTSWSRVYCVTALGPGLIRVSPDWAGAATPVVIFADTAVGGLNGVNNVFVSSTGGDVFSIRSSPVPGVLLIDIAMESGTKVYAAQGANVYESSNACWTYDPAVPTNATAIINLSVPMPDHLLVGGTGAVSYSTDGAATFTRTVVGLPPGGTFRVVGAEDYADTSNIFAGDTAPIAAGRGQTLRFTIGVSSAWGNLGSPNSRLTVAQGNPRPVTGVAHLNGALYAMTTAVGADRNLFSNYEPGVVAVLWDTMQAPGAPLTGNVPPVGPASGPGIFTVASADVGNVVYTAAGVVLAGYDDWIAGTPMDVLTPPSPYEVPLDPVTGVAQDIWATWNPIGAGTGMVNTVNIRVWETAMGAGGATQAAAGVLGIAPRTDIVALMGGVPYVLRANADYQWQIQIANTTSLDAIRGPWSPVYDFTVAPGTTVVATQAGPILQSPAPGATATSVNPGFSWVPEPNTTEWQFWLATDAALTQTVEGTPVITDTPSWKVPAGTLEYSSTYFWAVQSTKPTTGSMQYASFTTMAEPVEPLPAADVIVNIPVSETPAYVWGIIGVGAVLVIVVLVLIVRTRRPM